MFEGEPDHLKSGGTGPGHVPRRTSVTIASRTGALN